MEWGQLRSRESGTIILFVCELAGLPIFSVFNEIVTFAHSFVLTQRSGGPLDEEPRALGWADPVY